MEAVGKLPPGSDIDQLVAQVRQLATSQQLVVVRGTPISEGRWGYLVVLDHHDLSAEEFCQLAAFSGAKLLYVKIEGFDVGTHPDRAFGWHRQNNRDNQVSEEVEKFYRDVEQFNGRARQLELAFAAECVLHCWVVAADWYLSLIDRAAELFSPKDQPNLGFS